MGGSHPRVIKVLKKYLVMEAKDKKGAQICGKAKGKMALVRSVVVTSIALLIAARVRFPPNPIITIVGYMSSILPRHF
jgi:hypothetical protein